ncbi:MAG: FAD-dependent oxidoreductase [Acidimicrobiales bacterium]
MHIIAIGGSDAGISAALRARELDPGCDVTVVVADAYPNFSICGIPYFISGEVTHWRNLAHRSIADLEATGMQLRLDTLVTRIDVDGHRVRVRNAEGGEESLSYDRLVVGTGAVPIRPSIQGLSGLEALGPTDGVQILHSMGDTFALTRSLEELQPETSLIVGAGYVGLEMADGLTVRGVRVAQVEMLDEVLPTVDPELGSLVRTALTDHGVEVTTGMTIRRISRAGAGTAGRLRVEGVSNEGAPFERFVDLVLVSVGVRPDTELLVAAGAKTGERGAVVVDEAMRTGLPDVFAAGDCVVTHHRLLGTTYLPLGTTAHKQGRVAGENAVGGDGRFAGSLGTQVLKVFDVVAARTGLRQHEALAAGFSPATTQSAPDDHKAYYPTAYPITSRVTGDTSTGRLLGAQLVGRRGTEVSKRIDTFAASIYAGMTVEAMAELDLSYTPPLGSPWDAVQMASEAWVREHQLEAKRQSISTSEVGAQEPTTSEGGKP